MPKRFFAVLHLFSEDIEGRSIEQAKVAFSNGADGIFMIPAEGGMKPEVTLSCYHQVRTAFPSAFIGVNFMLPPHTVIKYAPKDADAIWTDYGIGVRDNSKDVWDMMNNLANNGWKGQLFGGFYFKGNNSVIPSDMTLKEHVEKMEMVSDVLTTSGSTTGVPIEIDVVHRISKFAQKQVCVASGVTSDNVQDILPYTDIVIIGTGIEVDSEDPVHIEFYKSAGLPHAAVKVGSLCAQKVSALSKKIKMYNQSQALESHANDEKLIEYSEYLEIPREKFMKFEEIAKEINQNIDSEQVAEAFEAFNLFDKDGDGYMLTKEFRTIMRSLGLSPTYLELVELMDNCPGLNDDKVHGGGLFSFEEFLMMYASFMRLH